MGKAVNDITIYTKNGDVRYKLNNYTQLCAIKSAEQKKELLGEDSVTIKVTSAVPLECSIGDYIVVYGETYTLNSAEEPIKKGSREFEYSFTFEGLQYKLIDAQFRNTDAGGYNPTASFSVMADLQLLMELIINNVNRVAHSLGENWQLGTCPQGTEFKEYTYNNQNCLAVLQSVCEEYKTEFDIEAKGNKQYVLNVRKQGNIFPLTFDFSKQAGVVKLQRKNVNTGEIVTRLYIEGGTQNISSNYRNGSERLRIGTNKESYVEDAKAIAAFGIKEGGKIYDHIIPKRTGKVSAIVADNTLQFVDSEMFDLTAKDAKGNTLYLIDGTAAKIKFTGTSNLAGYEFTISGYDHATHTFTIEQYESKRGLKIPDGGSYKIEVGNTYVLYDIVMPQDPYVTDAEALLERTGNDDLKSLCQPKVDYELDIASMALERSQGMDGAIVNVFKVGDYLHIKDTDLCVDKNIRIKSFVRDAYQDPYKYKVTLSDTIEATLVEKLIEDVVKHEEIIKINDLTNLAKARANWRTTQELLNMVYDNDGYFDTANIKPNSIETMMLSVGNRAGQFVIKDLVITANAVSNNKPAPQLIKIATSGNAQLIHYAIEEKDRVWNLAANASSILTLTDVGAYYLYARCPKNGNTFSIAVSQSKMPVDDGANYHFIVGVISSIFNGYRELTLTYGATRITGRCINCGRIESIDKKTYFDLDKSEIGGNIKFVSTDGTLKSMSTLEQSVAGAHDAIDGLTTQVGNQGTAIDGLTTQVGNQGTQINGIVDNNKIMQQGINANSTTITEMQAYVNGQGQTIAELQRITEQLQQQVDGTIEYWYGAVVPTLSNEPAASWNTEALRKEHVGDMYTNTATGLEYRYSLKVEGGKNVYFWQEVASTGVGTAIQAANQAIDIANGKNHTYVTANANTPPPATYKVGDLWVMLDTLKFKYCIADNDGVGYKAAHWKAAGYTDDTTANKAVTLLQQLASDSIVTPAEKIQMKTMWAELTADYAVINGQATAAGVSATAMVQAFTAIKNIVASVLQNMSVNSSIDRKTFDANVTNYYKARAEVLRSITDKKSTIHVTANAGTYPPTTYRKGDLWFMLDTYKVKVCVSSCANGRYSSADWKDAGYTDDTAANKAQEQLNALADDSMLTPNEKLTMQTEISNINADFVATSGRATALGVNTEEFEAAYNALKSYSNGLLTNMGTTSTINRTEYNSKFAAYYTQRTNIMLEISKKYVDDLEIGQGNYIANGAYFVATTGWAWDTDKQQLYADSVMGSVLRFGKHTTNSSFFLYTGFHSQGGNMMLPENKFMAGRKYTLAFWVKGSKSMQMLVGIMEPTGTKAVAPYVKFSINTNWQRITYTFTAQPNSLANTRLYISGGNITFDYCLFTKFVLVEGTKAPEWTDSSREYKAQLEANQQTLKAITDNYTQINGGLILSTFLKLGAVLTSGIYQESAGIKAMMNNPNEVAAYFGGTLADAIAGVKDAMTVIYHNGKLKSKNAEITGEINATKGTFRNVKVNGSLRSPYIVPNDSFDVNINDNISLISNGGGWVDAYSLPWDASQSGRRISIVNWKWGSSVSEGYAAISAPKGMHFFEDGIQKDELRVSRQIIELMGYGTPTQFYGWIITNRQNLMTTYRYGKCLRVLAIGSVTCNTSTGRSPQITYTDFEGSSNSLSVTRHGEGLYRVHYPQNWFAHSDHVLPMVCGTGYVYGSGSSPCKATLMGKTTSYFEVHISDDATRNDGSFIFTLQNLADWT